MLNKDGIRELAYVVRISEVRDIEGVNNQVAIVNGWQVFVKRDEFKPGDLAVYFEIDPFFSTLNSFNFSIFIFNDLFLLFLVSTSKFIFEYT